MFIIYPNVFSTLFSLLNCNLNVFDCKETLLNLSKKKNYFSWRKERNIRIKWHFKLNCIEIQNEYVAVYFAKVKQLGCSFKFVFPKEKKMN